MNEIPESVVKIIQAMTDRALARCAREGIALEDFCRAVLEERKFRGRTNAKSSVAELFENAFARLKTAAN